MLQTEKIYFYGVSTNGSFLKDEVSIIENKKKEKIKEIFLIKEKLSRNQIQYLNKFKTLKQKIQHLNKIKHTPNLNVDLKQVLKKADVIIYGPGTQNSSLLPSY